MLSKDKFMNPLLSLSRLDGNPGVIILG